MNRGLFSFLLLFIALLMSALGYSDTLQKPIINSLNSLKILYLDSTEYVTQSINKHFYQAQKIEHLEKELELYKSNHLLMQQLASELQELLKENRSPFRVKPKVELARTISYEKFGNMNRAWIDMQDANTSKIYGLIYKELVAGIVIFKNNRPLALLNRDIKSSYAVYIGEQKAPGIAHGNNAKNILVKFIPTWFKINVGDEIVTSGLDNIFFRGLKVGKVISVSSAQGYQNAVVEPYYQGNELGYFHIIKGVK
jgi:rod shape-determining protein MreC